MAVSGISNFTFLRSIETAAIGRPNPLLRGTDATFSISPGPCRFLSLPLLGPVADGFDDCLAANGYTRVSRQNSIRMLPHVDAELRRRQVKELANLAQAVLRGCWRTLRKDRPNTECSLARPRLYSGQGLRTYHRGPGVPTGLSAGALLVQ
jgi:hypothetical protein